MEDFVAMFLESIKRTESEIRDLEIKQVDVRLNSIKKTNFFTEKVLMLNKRELEVCYMLKEKHEKSLNNKESTLDIKDIKKAIEFAKEKVEVVKRELKENNECIAEAKEEKEEIKMIYDNLNRLDMDEKLCLAFRIK